MNVTVRLFARARDLAGTDVVTITMPPGSTVADLRCRLGAQVPALAGLLARCAVAVDEEFADDAVALRERSTVALLPPVSGG